MAGESHDIMNRSIISTTVTSSVIIVLIYKLWFITIEYTADYLITLPMTSSWQWTGFPKIIILGAGIYCLILSVVCTQVFQFFRFIFTSHSPNSSNSFEEIFLMSSSTQVSYEIRFDMTLVKYFLSVFTILFVDKYYVFNYIYI